MRDRIYSIILASQADDDDLAQKNLRKQHDVETGLASNFGIGFFGHNLSSFRYQCCTLTPSNTGSGVSVPIKWQTHMMQIRFDALQWSIRCRLIAIHQWQNVMLPVVGIAQRRTALVVLLGKEGRSKGRSRQYVRR